jgi:teichuronic acid biosynthesis glycosyltransferase TuaH
VLYLWHLHLVPYVRHLDADVVIYHMFDLVNHSWKDDSSGREAETWFHEICSRADLCVGSTPAQASLLPPKKSHIFPNAAPVEWYDSETLEPSEMGPIPRPRIGYVGRIGEKVDFRWLEHIADVEGWSVVLIGPVMKSVHQEEQYLSLLKRPNVYSLGFRSADRVPAYIKSLDVGLMCYRRGHLHEARSPIKLYEYCAAGLQSVGTRLDSLVQDPTLPDSVVLVDEPQQAVAAIRRLLDSDSEERRASTRRFASNNSWTQRAKRLLELVDNKLKGAT